MGIRVNIACQKFGRLKAITWLHNERTKWLCECDCGNDVNVRTNDLRQGKVKSCGCLRNETSKSKATKHGLRQTREYRIWCNMKTRCTNVNYEKFHRYGGRGITICDRWLNSFSNFYKDMGKATTNKHSIDRINNNGNYEPDNCRWATALEQSQNKGY